MSSPGAPAVLCLVYSAQANQRARRNVFHVTYPLGTEDHYTFYMSSANVTALSSYMRDVGAQFIRLTVYAVVSTSPEPVMLSNSGVFSISELMPDPSHVLGIRHYIIRMGTEGDTLQMDRRNSANGGGLSAVRWTGDRHLVTRLFLTQ